MLYFAVIMVISLSYILSFWSPLEGSTLATNSSVSFSNPTSEILEKFKNNNQNIIEVDRKNLTSTTSNGTTYTVLVTNLINNKSLLQTAKTTEWTTSSNNKEILLVQISVLFGILGASIHGFTSLAMWISTDKLKKSYVPWFITKPFIGGTLAVIVYALLRASLFSGGMTSNGMLSQQVFINDYGVAGISALVGLMTGQMTQKLRDVFDSLFGINKGSDKGDIISDRNLILIPSELKLQKNEESIIVVSLRDNNDEPIKDAKIIFKISDPNKLESLDSEVKSTDNKGSTFTKVKGKNPGKTEIVVYSKVLDNKFLDSISVEVFDNGQVSPSTPTPTEPSPSTPTPTEPSPSTPTPTEPSPSTPTPTEPSPKNNQIFSKN
jgi:hypothetical protein